MHWHPQDKSVETVSAPLMMISVVTPVYRGGNFVARFARGLAKCSHCVPYELIVIDDGGNSLENWDPLLELVNHCEMFTSIRIIRNTSNRGVTFSRNRGYAEAQGTYIVFMDIDDLFVPNALDSMACVLTRNDLPGVALFATQESTGPEGCSSGFDMLVSDYNRGERLVVVRAGLKTLPFLSHLRGHEFAGLLRFVTREKLRVIVSNVCVRTYMHDNQYSISSGDGLSRRRSLIAKGHLISAKILLTEGYLLPSLRFYVLAARSYSLWLVRK